MKTEGILKKATAVHDTWNKFWPY
ncbi:uncharacterized protein METZ01_LOCUS395300 [marine metagenome]|uniref:Uncharacterized protein n=1 Tax=marine metagenome TaxID=408172 RepID=A0A382V797_9ZZZZ